MAIFHGGIGTASTWRESGISTATSRLRRGERVRDLERLQHDEHQYCVLKPQGPTCDDHHDWRLQLNQQLDDAFDKEFMEEVILKVGSQLAGGRGQPSEVGGTSQLQNSSTQKLKCLISLCTNPVSILSVPNSNRPLKP